MSAGSGTAGRATAGRLSPRVIAAVALAVLAVALIILGVIYLVEPARSLPSFLPGHVPGSARDHPLRTAGCFLIGLMFLAGAWVALTVRSEAALSRLTAGPLSHWAA